MQNLLLLLESTSDSYVPIIIEALVTIGAIFGGTGFWQWKQAKDQAKRDKLSKESGVEKKVDILTENFSILSQKVDAISSGMDDIKDDILLLQKANEETQKYREFRDNRDKQNIVMQQAIIQSLTGILRERLLDNYHQCIEKGYYTKEEREVYGEMFKCYTQAPFNGKGVMHDLQPIMKALPWTTEDAKPQDFK